MVSKIEVNNYRCFAHLELSFRQQMNLLIGDNASGKTTLMKALSSVLNAFFSGFSDENTRFWGLAKDDFTNIQTSTGLANEKPIMVKFENLGISAALELHSKKGRTLQRPLEPLIDFAHDLYEGLFDDKDVQVKALPLFASFSTNDIHSTRKISAEKFKKYNHKPSFGYYECLQGDGFLPYWTTRLLVLTEGKKAANEVASVIKSVLDMLGPAGCNIISGMEVRPIQQKVYYVLADGREVETGCLSDGYKRLINISLDLAFRAIILNFGIYGIEAACNTKGTVLIDEIDLHLHPTLQSSVISGIQNAFPNIQFIITTHAPMVMTGVPASEKSIVYHLHYSGKTGYSANPISLYGLDASTIIKVALQTIPRSKEVDNRLEILFNLIDADDYIQAQSALKNLKAEFEDKLPELAKAEAMLNFLSRDNDSD